MGEGQPHTRPPQHPLTFRLDLDALAPERDALWTRLEKTSFLSNSEKRAAIGYDESSVIVKSIRRKYRPDQERDEQGRWIDEVGAENSDNSGDQTTAGDASFTPVAARGRGGFAKEVLEWSVRQFVSSYCKGKVNAELPGQFEDITIAELIDLAKGGDAAAKKCQKLLKEPRFRK